MQVLVVDYRSPEAPERFTRSLRETGFAAIVNHPLPAGLVDGIYAEWEAFFVSGAARRYLHTDRQDGYYFETSYKLLESLGIFARYNFVDNGGGAGSIARDQFTQTDLGVNYWPIKNIVLKADYQNQARDRDDDGFNLGIGYQF